MIKFLSILLTVIFIVSCSKPINELPEYWEYSPGKWVAFKTRIEIQWEYDDTNIDKFRIERRKLELSTKDKLAINSLIHRKDLEGLIEKENSLRNKINFNTKIESFQPSIELSYKDVDSHKPAFGEIRFYRVLAIKDFATSPPADLSVILLDRSN